MQRIFCPKSWRSPIGKGVSQLLLELDRVNVTEQKTTEPVL